MWFLHLPFTAAIALTFGHTPDDPLITLRYAANLLHGHGAVFNVGEHVQGFSSPLHLLVSMVVVAPGTHALLLAKLLSVAFGALTLHEGAALVDRLRLAWWATRVGYLLLGTSFVLAMSAANGLETSMAAWLVVLLVRMLVDGGGVADPWRTGVVACALTLTRPEGIALVAGLALVSLALERSADVRRRAEWAGGGLLGVVVVLVQALFVLRAGGDWMLGGRFVAPAVVPALVVALVGVAAVAGTFSRARASARLAATVGAAVVGAVIVVSPFVARRVPAWASDGRLHDAALVESGGYAEYSAFWSELPSLVSCVGSGGSVATTEVGNLGFARQDLHVLDLRGLTDEFIAAHAPAASKHPWGVALDGWDVSTSVIGRRILQVQPDAIVLLERRGTLPGAGARCGLPEVRVVTVAPDDRAAVYVPAASTSPCDRA